MTNNNIVSFVMMYSTLVKSSTVLPAKSDIDVMFCLQNYQGLVITCVSIDTHQLKWSVQINVYLSL